MSSLDSIIDKIQALSNSLINEQKAIQYKDYLKGHFDFLGYGSDHRKEIIKVVYPDVKKLDITTLISLMRKLWTLPYREYQYIAIDLAKKKEKLFTQHHISDIEHFITHKSWWDSVDLLATNILGQALYDHRDLQYEYTDRLINSDHMWLRRSALIFQLKYREKTDFDLLSSHILHTINEKEFFIRKAQGWALRQYGKFNPIAVSQFIDTYRDLLSPLAIKEGSKYL